MGLWGDRHIGPRGDALGSSEIGKTRLPCGRGTITMKTSCGLRRCEILIRCHKSRIFLLLYDDDGFANYLVR
jgi:hypothetical protein